MASTYSTNLALELIGSGDQAGSWGNTTNTNLGTLIEQAISGYVTQAVSTGTDTTITIPNGSTGVARNMYIELTGTGGTNTNLIVPANKKLYFIFNNSTGAVTVKVSGQTGVSVPAAAKMSLVSNGTDVVSAVTYFAALSSASLTLSGNLTLNGGTANQVQYLNASKVLTGSSNLTFDGTTLTANAATVSNALTLSGGTANGVLYLNGSKAATSGSALTFDGNVQQIGAGSTANTAIGLRINATNNAANGGFIAAQRNGSDSWLLSDTAAAIGSGTGFVTYVYGANPAIWYTNAAERMRLDSSGNLGIGTSSPTGKLHISGNFIRVEQSGANDLYMGRASDLISGSPTGAAIRYDGTALRIGASSTEVATFSGGNLGLGTSSPSYKLDVLDGTANGGAGTPIARIVGANQAITSETGTLSVQSNSNMAADAGGSIILGGRPTTASTNSASFAHIAGRKENGTSGNFAGYLQFGTSDSASDIVERMRLDSSGNLGIGTSSPGYKLKVNSASATNGLVAAFENSGSTGAGIAFVQAGVDQYDIRMPAGSNSLAFYASGTTERMRLDASGNLGIGTSSPTRKVSIVGSAADTYVNINSGDNTSLVGLLFGGTSTPSAGQVVYDNTGNSMRFVGNGSEFMRLDASGNFGIGTSSPAFKLDVNGAVQATDYRAAASTTLFVTGDSVTIRTTGAANRLTIDSNGSATIGVASLATTAVDGFLYVPTCAGTPTGTPTAKSGYAPIVVDTTNNKLYFYSTGVWRDAGP